MKILSKVKVFTKADNQDVSMVEDIERYVTVNDFKDLSKYAMEHCKRVFK